jgi:ATP-dependent RNA helicase RhlE
VSQQSFIALGVGAPVADALAIGGIDAPFAVQELVLPDALAGLDVLTQAPTGSGKTLAFGLALVERTSVDDPQPNALVLVPTRELAVQVANDLRPLARVKGLRTACVYGGVPLTAQAKLARGAHLLIATPGRLHDLLERRLLSLERTRALVLDEADRMLDMGFKPQVDKIVARLPRNRQTMLFSATLDGAVAELARAYTVNPSRYRSDPPAELRHGKVEHSFVAVTTEGKIERLVEQLAADRGLALVFVRTKRGAERLVKKLANHGANAVAMHGDMTQPARERALARFDSGHVTTLVATDVAARGLDVDDITHVINFDPPEDDTAYVHRVGRTARAGRSGSAITLVLPEQQPDVSRIAARLGHQREFEAAGMHLAPPRLVYSSRRRRRSTRAAPPR